jgi:hypothetical protein
MRCASAAATTPPTRWPRWRWPAPSAARWRRCCTACASTRRAAPRGVRRQRRRRRGLRRQQGHQRRRHRGRARRAWAPTSTPGKLVVILGGDGKGQDFAPLARRWRACARGGPDRPRCRRHRGRRWRPRRGAAAPRHAGGRGGLVLRARSRRRGAAQPGLRQPGHVPQLRHRAEVFVPPCSAGGRARGGSHDTPLRERIRRLALATRSAQWAPRRGAAEAAMPVRDWINAPARRRPPRSAASTRRWCGSSGAARARPGDGLFGARSRCPTTRSSRATRPRTSCRATRSIAGIGRLARWRWCRSR